jgi:putative tryptophan/tyrosine transport system substrate-binding protein
MRRREFITLLGGGAMVLPSVGLAQPIEKVRRVGVLMTYPDNDPEGQIRAQAFQRGLEKLGWTVGRNLELNYHWGVGDVDWTRSAATELLKLAPDAVLANGGQAARVLQQATGTIPIVFIGGGGDPVAEGFVQSLARPGGNVTGFTVLEPSLGAKLLELLVEIAPRLARVVVMVNQDNPSPVRLAASAASAAQKFGVEVITASFRGAAEIEAAMTAGAREPAFGLIIPADPTTNAHRKLIVELAARYRLPAIHALRAATVEGGLMSYGVDLPDLFRQSAAYVDRILRGERPADLPVQQPTRFELLINLKTAKALGLEVPPTLLARADEVIE